MRKVCFKRTFFHPFVKAALIAIFWVSMVSIPHAGTNPPTSVGGASIEQMTLAPGAMNPDDLIPDTEKDHRLHPSQQSVSSAAGSSVPLDHIKELLRPGRVDLRFTASAANRNGSLRTLIGDRAGKIAARVLFNSKNGTPRMIKIQSKSTAVHSQSLVRRALDLEVADNFLSANRELLKIDDPVEEFEVKRKWTDHLGAHHVRYQQQYNGLPVWGREVVVHMDGGNQVYMLQGNFEPSPKTSENVFAVSEAQALEAVYRHLELSGAAPDAVESIEAVWFTPANGNPLTAYCIKIQPSMLQNWIYFVGAESGEVLHRISRVNTEIITASGTDLNGVSQTFTAWRDPESGDQVLIDPTIPLNDEPHEPIPTKAFGETYLFDLRNQMEGDIFYFQGPDWDAAAVSMIDHIRSIDEYYRNAFDRHGMDHNNKNNLLVAHQGEDHPNACWNGTYIIFGEGDNQTFSNLAGSLDVTAHEYTHAVVGFTAGLIYENQSGALNEAYADIFACMVDRDDWLVGEEITVAPPFHLRNLADPSDGLSPLPGKMSEYRNLPVDDDYGGVHINCGIPSRAAYLMAEGMSAENLGTSIGRDKTEQIFYRALTVYLTQSSNFIDAREATIQAAQDLYGAEDAAAVQAAWDAVEVYENIQPEPDDPTPADPISGNDIMVYLRLQPNQERLYDVYLQRIPDPFQGYDPAQEIGPLNTAPAAIMRPAAITIGGTHIFYVDSSYNLHEIFISGNSVEDSQITDDGSIRSFAISPDGHYIAYTRADINDNHIYIGDLETLQETGYELISPSTTPGGDGGLNTILYASGLSFDYSSRTLIFDAYNQMDIGGAGDQYTYWSIGTLDLHTGLFSWPFPNQNPNYDIVNSIFAYNNSYVIAFDMIDHSTNPSTSIVYTMDLSTQSLQGVANLNTQNYNYGHDISGVPSFWGDDDAITLQAFGPDIGSIAYKVPLDENWAGLPQQGVQLNDYPLLAPVMHRLGERRLSAEIRTDKGACQFDFGGGSQEITLRNTGNRDIEIFNIAITGPGEQSFRHDGVNGILPRGADKTIAVYFQPVGDAGGAQSANLVIHSDADTPMVEVSLTGDSGNSISEDGESGGCFISAMSR